MDENRNPLTEAENQQNPENESIPENIHRNGGIENPYDSPRDEKKETEYGLKEETETGLKETEHEIYRTVSHPAAGEMSCSESDGTSGPFPDEKPEVNTGGDRGYGSGPETRSCASEKQDDDRETYTFVNDAAGGAEIRVEKPTRILRLAKPTLVVLLLVVLVAGAGIGFLALRFYYADHAVEIAAENEDYVVLPAETFAEYERYVEKYSKAETLMQYISTVYYQDVDEDELMDGMLHGLVSGLEDEYSEYLSASELEAMEQSYEGEFYGIGVQISNQNGQITVVAPIDGTPAFKAGIRAGDVITHVDGIAYSGEELNDAVNHMRGEAGKEVTVTVLRDGVSKEYTFVREKITTETVTSKMLENNIGYIRISEFESNTGEVFSEKLEEMEKAGADGLVVDLRSNPGGLVTEAVKVADEFLDACIVTTIRDKDGNEESYSAKRGKTDLPVVFLCDEGSASASEILLAAMKDYGVGEIIGNTTYGKGIVQEFGSLFSDGSGLKLTRFEYFSPNGNTVHKVGVTPTIELDYREDLDEEDYDELGYLRYESDDQLQKAVELLSE